MTTNDLEVAWALLDRLGIQPEALLRTPRKNGRTPTFAEYTQRVAEAVSEGARRTYLPYWRKLAQRWPDRGIDEPTSLELQGLVEETRQNAIVRRNSRGGRSAAEHMVGAIRVLYQFAANDDYITVSANPGPHLRKPRRLPSTRRALSARQLAQINHAVTTTGNDRELDSLILRLHLETACRTGSALKLRPEDVETEHCMIRLFGKGGTVHWQPVSPTLIAMLIEHARRSTDPAEQLLRYLDGRPISRRRYDHIWARVGRQLPWVSTQQISTHWIRHTTLTWVERNFGYATARAFAAHAEPTGLDGATLTYVRASIEDVAAAVAALTGEPHPLVPADRGIDGALAPIDGDSA
ncbi:tyrosine-type recombinase/integrase [Nocardia cyriacigeorgica]|uniref:tyrosine-type recombinase/integrase n=1 Tax=Nocardia cyriacigeorgica TaxID=135487 RepID=UPI0024548265|nr:tyrosine-type recombinase/integrase [Nocardia cyriacigeorgica]